MYYKGQQEIRELFKQHHGALVLKRDSEQIWDITKTSYRPAVPFSLPVEAYVNLPSLGSVAVRYSKNAPVLVDRNYVYTGNRIMIHDRLHLKEDQIDLAWYIIKASKFVEVTDEEGNSIDRSGSRFLKIDNPEIEIKKISKQNKRIAELDKFIYFDDSPIYNLDAVKHISNQFGIEIKANTIDTAMHQVRSAVLAGEKNKHPEINIDRFIAYCNALGRREYSKEWDGEIPEGGWNLVQLKAYGYESLKAIGEKLELGLGHNPKKDLLIEKIMDTNTEKV